ncbi:hypothetical protein LSH36_24g10041 [Paralvinella palmiformis]|uniref:Cationic amino acid transporter n=1 Tax=Paralvinella palmiformis TaxID=53620 RepID=A0AAD9KAL8_9ANNE|nr:hypothetical protein LSH36_24g10041 [Paralvinella palmiformis]
MASCCSRSDCGDTFTRKKTITSILLTSNLRRCLSTFDLILLGIGSMVGTGIFVLTGQVAHSEAGPSVVISYMIAAVASAMSAVCYAEFASLVPLSGSCFSYTYIAVGEVWAFLVGWNMILENVIGISAAAKSWSGTLDSLCNGSISQAIQNAVGAMHVRYISSYPDFVAFAIILFVMIFVLVGAKISANFNKVIVIIKLLVVGIIIVAGFALADLSNWIDPQRGGFFPYGASGTIAGSATCFYGFVGFDSLCTASEETKDPKRSLPIAIIGSLVIVTSLYILSAMSLTLMVPYTDIDPASAFTAAFVQRGNVWATYVVGIGTLFGLASIILGGLFAVPRVLYAMSSDGLIFHSISYIHPKTQTPILAIFITAFLSSMLAVFFDLQVLVELLSIGTLFCFTFVAMAIVIIRYTEMVTHAADVTVSKEDIREGIPLEPSRKTATNYDSGANQTLKSAEESSPCGYFRSIRKSIESSDKSRLLSGSLASFLISTFSFALLLLYGWRLVAAATWWAIVLLIVLAVGYFLKFLLDADVKLDDMDQIARLDHN